MKKFLGVFMFVQMMALPMAMAEVSHFFCDVYGADNDKIPVKSFEVDLEIAEDSNSVIVSDLEFALESYTDEESVSSVTLSSLKYHSKLCTT